MVASVEVEVAQASTIPRHAKGCVTACLLSKLNAQNNVMPMVQMVSGCPHFIHIFNKDECTIDQQLAERCCTGAGRRSPGGSTFLRETTSWSQS